jgi:metal-responsive CopG/Arc/MetJ family transcriptional regulator
MSAAASEVVVVRLSKKTLGKLDRAAHKRGLKRSEFVRQVIESNIGDGGDLAAEAHRQSLLVSRLDSERGANDLIADTMSTDGWR